MTFHDIQPTVEELIERALRRNPIFNQERHVDDLRQCARIRVWQYLPYLDSHRNMRAWLSSHISMAMLDAFRQMRTFGPKRLRGINKGRRFCGQPYNETTGMEVAYYRGAMRVTVYRGCESDDPLRQLEEKQMARQVRRAIVRLPERLRRVAIPYYYGGRSLKELAKRRGVTEARMSQLKSAAVRTMKEAGDE